MTAPTTFVTIEELRLAHARCAWIAREKPSISYSPARQPDYYWEVRVGREVFYGPTFHGVVDMAMEAIP